MRRLIPSKRMLHENRHVSIRRAAPAVLAMGAILLAVVVLPAPTWMRGMAGYAAAHLLVELVAIVASAMVFAVAWSGLRRHGRPDAAWLGAAFLGVALLDLGHALSYAGMPDLVTPSSPDKAIAFWLLARSLAALGLLGIVLRLPWRGSVRANGGVALAVVMGLVVAAFGAVLWWPQALPAMFVPGQGLTPLKIGWEVALVLAYAAVPVLLLVRARAANPFDVAHLFTAAVAMSLGEVCFTLYADVTDHYNMLGHAYKVVGYVYLYSAIFVATIDRPYRELAQAQSRLRTTLATIPDLLWLKDENGVYLDCNPRFEQLYNASREQIVGHTDRDFVSAELADVFRHHDLKALRAGGPSVNEEWLSFAADGYRGLFETIKTPVFDDAGRLIGVLGVARDITERHTAEQQRLALEAQLREAQKMESLGTLAGGVAHDFNNVLGAILGHAALAQADLPAGHPARAGLEQIRRSGLRARDLVQQILAFSRRQPQQRVPQPLRPLVEESLALLRATLPARVHLQARLHDAPLQVVVDGTQMQQVLMNLCTNAWHALGDAGGSMEVGLDAVAPVSSDDESGDHGMALAESPGWAHLWVRDNGPGMTPATLARIFEPFFTTKAPGQGTGLGLSVVHGIVRAHDGRIRVDTAPGEGATFHVYLPLQTRQDTQAGVLPPPEPAPQLAAVPSSLVGHGRDVLYVDDDDVMATMVDQLLRRDGWRVTVRGGVAEALALFRADPGAFDVVVTDYSMPDGTGLDLASAMKLLRPDLPVIVSTGYISEQLTAGMAAAGVRRVLRKERTLEELPQQLHELLPAEPAA